MRDSYAAVRQLRRLYRDLNPIIVHNVALKPVVLGTIAGWSFGQTAIVNSLTGLGMLFVDGSGSSGITRKLVEAALSRLGSF